MRFLRRSRIVAIVATSLGLAAVAFYASWKLPGTLRPVEITKEDNAAPNPLDPAAAAQKLEWRFFSNAYVRTIVERRDAKDAPWREVGSYPWGMPCSRATLLYQVTTVNPVPRSSEYFFYLNLRVGGVSSSLFRVGGWTGSNVRIDLPKSEYQTESHFDDPDRVLQITSGDRSYRVRLERGFRPFSLRYAVR